MINLLIAIDLEVKFRKLRAVDRAVDQLSVLDPVNTRRLFTYMYKAYPSKLLLEYELKADERAHSMHHVAHAVVA